jgi:glycogen operon protein
VHVTLENETDTLEFTRSPKPEKETSTKTTGLSSPLGATVTANGVNFSVFSRKATSIELLVFEREDDARPARVIHIDSVTNRTYHYWHVFVPGAQAGQIYAYHVHGPFDPAKGLQFCWIPTAVGLSFPTTTVVAQLVKKATTQPRL